MKEVCSSTNISSNGSNNKSELWKAVLNELRGSLHSAKEMFNMTLKIESIEEDEKFDCQLIELIVEVLIPFNRIDPAQSNFVDEAVDLIFGVGRITKFSNEIGSNDNFSFPSGVKTLPISVKEILSFSAYKSIFRLAKEELRVKEKLTGLLKMHLEAYLCDRQIFGNDFPFPRLRDAELYVLLRGMRHLLAREELKQVYNLIVKCADFGGSGACEGVRIVVGECRKVLLLLDESRGKDIDTSEDSEDTECEDSECGVTDNLITDCGDIDILVCKPSGTTTHKAQSLEKPQTPIQQTLIQQSNPPTSISSRRSVSEELFDHLTHDLRIMQFSQESNE